MPADITAIAAVAQNGVIGADGGLPWHYPADLKHFKEETAGSGVVMGRKTYESLPSKLEGRELLVVSKSRNFSELNVRTISTPQAALALCLRRHGEAYIAGGESIYECMLGVCNRAIITEIPEEPEGDASWPGLSDDWQLAEERDGPDGLVFRTYEKHDPRTTHR